jgi:hypothetical protein
MLSTKYLMSHINCHPLLPLRPASLAASIKSYTMDFVLGDFCLSCDRQTNDTAFCSSACRFNQLDRFTLAESTTSTASCGDRNTPTVSQHPVLSVSTTGFYLPPAYDFSIHRTSSSKPLPVSISSRSHSPNLSEQAQNDLKDYVDAFDQIRTLQRRVLMQSNDNSKTSPIA